MTKATWRGEGLFGLPSTSSRQELKEGSNLGPGADPEAMAECSLLAGYPWLPQPAFYNRCSDCVKASLQNYLHPFVCSQRLWWENIAGNISIKYCPYVFLCAIISQIFFLMLAKGQQDDSAGKCNCHQGNDPSSISRTTWWMGRTNSSDLHFSTLLHIYIHTKKDTNKT